MSWLTKTILSLSPNCKEAIRLQSEALDHPLPPLRRIGLRIHLALCVWCSRYGKQIKFLRTAAQKCEHDHAPNTALSAEARERIKRKLQTGKN
jgi:hypothetical protein